MCKYYKLQCALCLKIYLVKRHWFVLGKDITYAYTIAHINRSTLFAVNDDRKVSVRASPAETDRSFFYSRNRTAKIMSQR